MTRVRVAYTAGEAIGPDLFNFYRSLGINLKQLYGQTETAVFVYHAARRRGQARHGRHAGRRASRSGSPRPARCSIAVPGVFKEYYKNPRRPATTKTADGWVHTGDAGFLDARGHLQIIDRAKDVGQAERRHAVRAQVHREQAEVLPAHQGGGGLRRRPRLRLRRSSTSTSRRSATGPSGATSPMRATPTWPRSREVYELIRRCVEQVNADLAADAALAGAPDQPLPDPAQGARRRRRRADAHQQGAPRLHRRALRRRWSTRSTAASRAVTSRPRSRFEDGRKGTIEGDVEIRDAPTRRRRCAARHATLRTQAQLARSSTDAARRAQFGEVAPRRSRTSACRSAA